MTNEFFSTVVSLVLVSLTAMTIENVVLSRGLAISRLVAMMDDTKDTTLFTVLLAIVSSLSSVIYYYLNRSFLIGNDFAEPLRPLVAILSIIPVYIIVFIVIKVLPSNISRKALEPLPLASFNIAVVSSLVVPATARMSLESTVAYAIGASIGFALAVVLVVEGQRKVMNRDIPTPFKGKPAMYLYFAGLAMAIYALAGRIFTIL